MDITALDVFLGDGRAEGAHLPILLLAIQQGEPLTWLGPHGLLAFS